MSNGASNSSPGKKSVAERLREQTLAYKSAAQNAMGPNKKALRGIQAEVIDLQNERIEQLQAEILDLKGKLAIYEFDERTREAEKIRQQFPRKGRR